MAVSFAVCPAMVDLFESSLSRQNVIKGDKFQLPSRVLIRAATEALLQKNLPVRRRKRSHEAKRMMVTTNARRARLKEGCIDTQNDDQ